MPRVQGRGSGVPLCVVATLDGRVQTSEDVIPFSSTGITKFSVEMRKSHLWSDATTPPPNSCSRTWPSISYL